MRVPIPGPLRNKFVNKRCKVSIVTTHWILLLPSGRELYQYRFYYYLAHAIYMYICVCVCVCTYTHTQNTSFWVENFIYIAPKRWYHLSLFFFHVAVMVCRPTFSTMWQITQFKYSSLSVMFKLNVFSFFIDKGVSTGLIRLLLVPYSVM